jgi:hypothetical protein
VKVAEILAAAVAILPGPAGAYAGVVLLRFRLPKENQICVSCLSPQRLLFVAPP